jgi:hypothetical protein
LTWRIKYQSWQVVKKRSERSQDKAKIGEKPECTSGVHEDFEPIFNAVLASA